MITKIKLTGLLITLCSMMSSIVMAEMPATVKYQLAMSNQTSYDKMNAAHSGLASKTAQPFWSEKQKKSAEYEAKMLKAINDEPENKKNYANLANMYLANNKTLKAIGAYQDAINHDPDNPKLFAALSIAYLHQSKYSMAKVMAEQAIKLDPEMKHAKKIKEYILAKEEVIAQTSKQSPQPVDLKHKKDTH
ncbi:MAG: hypothetical protein QM479_16710 [Pseudomonadota bacterium]